MKVWLGDYLRDANYTDLMPQYDGLEFTVDLMNKIIDTRVPIVFLRIDERRKRDNLEVPKAAEVGDLLMCHPNEW